MVGWIGWIPWPEWMEKERQGAEIHRLRRLTQIIRDDRSKGRRLRSEVGDQRSTIADYPDEIRATKISWGRRRLR